MEDIKTEIKRIEKQGFYKKVVLSLLKNFKKGQLTLTLPNGEKQIFGDGRGLFVDLTIHNEQFYKRFVLYGDVGFGESYVAGDWSTTNLTLLIRWAIQNVESSGIMSGSKMKDISVNILGKLNKFEQFLKRNSISGSKSNISYHYDLSNEFYQLMLDSTMSYSCGIFAKGSESLENAQLLKLQKICSDLDIKSEDHILEIGCGWGSFAIYAVKKYNCKVTGVTVSKEQYKYLSDRIKEENLQENISIQLLDYRDVKGKFDKVVSIEMIEAVGHEYLPEYFNAIDRLLNDRGVAVIQAITSPDSRYDSFRKGVDFIQKHIFPGSLLPSIRAMQEACRNTSLQLINLRDIGLNYAKTLKIWEERVQLNKETIKNLGMDDTFFRKWKYYLNYCEAAFAERNISDVQLTFIKPNNTSYKYF